MNAITRLAAPALTAAALLLAPSPAAAVSVNYCDFSSTAGISINFNASKQGSTLQLTPNLMWQRGSAFTTTQIPFGAATSFHTYFRFSITPNAVGADGLVFVIQSGNANAIGNSGLGVGYEGIPASVAVEFDTYLNGTDPSGNHVALLADGSTTNHIASATPGFPLASDKDKYAWIDYDAATQALNIYLAEDPFKPATPLISTTFDVSAHLGANVRAGFVGATGGVSNVHAILEWQMSTDGFPCCVSAPGGACNDALPACGSNGLCVKCVSDVHCGGASPICVGNVCTPCVDDADCAGNPAGSTCSPTGACVECTSNADCPAASPKCDAASYKCVGCLSHLDCTAPTPACEPQTMGCVGCTEDGFCDADAVCDIKAKQCVIGCRVVNGKDTCVPGMKCDKTDGEIGSCHTVSSSSSSTSSSSSSSSSGSAGGAGGAGGAATGSGGSAPMNGGAGGGGPGGGGASTGGTGTTGIAPTGGCACGVSGNGASGAGLAAATLLAALGTRRRRRAAR